MVVDLGVFMELGDWFGLDLFVDKKFEYFFYDKYLSDIFFLMLFLDFFRLEKKGDKYGGGCVFELIRGYY